MRRTVFLLAIVGLFVAACASASPAPAPTTAPKAVNVVPQAAALKDYVASNPALVRNTGRPQVIEFFAFWCTVCQGMRPTMHALQDEFGQSVDFIYLDIDAENTKDLQRTLTFTGLRPTIIFLKSDGTETGRMFGDNPKENIAAQIDALTTVGG